SGGQHQAGTCRMGTNPATSVTDKWGRVWGHDNLVVVDGSLHVTNGGVNPVLTIMALAYRVSRRVAKEHLGPSRGPSTDEEDAPVQAADTSTGAWRGASSALPSLGGRQWPYCRLSLPESRALRLAGSQRAVGTGLPRHGGGGARTFNASTGRRSLDLQQSLDHEVASSTDLSAKGKPDRRQAVR